MVLSTYAVKREQRLASRRRSDIRFQDLYTRLNDEFSSILFATPVGVAYEFAEDIKNEMQLNPWYKFSYKINHSFKSGPFK